MEEAPITLKKKDSRNMLPLPRRLRKPLFVGGKANVTAATN